MEIHVSNRGVCAARCNYCPFRWCILKNRVSNIKLFISLLYIYHCSAILFFSLSEISHYVLNSFMNCANICVIFEILLYTDFCEVMFHINELVYLDQSQQLEQAALFAPVLPHHSSVTSVARLKSSGAGYAIVCNCA